uniref:adenylate kinase n=1 Tax=Salix viminalis TaxID=40686 RepID=A0A6N2LVG0_SALVM
MMVMEGLLLPDSQENGWLVDGYPRSLSQATALKEFGFQPDLFILLEVNEEILVERVVGRPCYWLMEIFPRTMSLHKLMVLSQNYLRIGSLHAIPCRGN